MTLKGKFGKWLAGAMFGAVSAFAQAGVYTVTIAGVVIPTTTAPVIPGSGYVPPEGVFTALGNCSQVQGFGNSCTDLIPGGGGAYVGAESSQLFTFADVDAKNADIAQWNFDNGRPPGTPLTYGVIYGATLPMDQVIFHYFSADVTVENNTVVSAAGLHQTFDFLAGSTGPGSAGSGTFQYTVNLFRTITVSGGNLSGPVQKTLMQQAVLTVGMEEDIVNILDSPTVSFDLGADGQLNVQLLAVEATMGDPGSDFVATAGTVPLPSTLALVLLGFFGFARRQRRLA